MAFTNYYIFCYCLYALYIVYPLLGLHHLVTTTYIQFRREKHCLVVLFRKEIQALHVTTVVDHIHGVNYPGVLLALDPRIKKNVIHPRVFVKKVKFYPCTNFTPAQL